jgi:hypothetical protein
VSIAKLLIAAGMDAKKSRGRCGKKGANASRSALNIASGLGSVRAVRFLIDHCGFSAAGEDSGDLDYMTPLMAAAVTGQVEVIEYLLLSGAATTAHLKTEDNLTAADLFSEKHARKDIKRKLLDAARKSGNKNKPRSVVTPPSPGLPTKWSTAKNRAESIDPLEVRMRSWISAGVEKFEGVPHQVREMLERYTDVTKEVELREFLLGLIEDEQFQEHMEIESVRHAVDDVIANFHNVSKYRENAIVMNVLYKFRHVQRFCKDRGEKISFDDILASTDEEVEIRREHVAELKAAAGVLWDDALLSLKSFTLGQDASAIVMDNSQQNMMNRMKHRLLDMVENVAVHSIASFVFAVTLAVFWRMGGFQRDDGIFAT